MKRIALILLVANAMVAHSSAHASSSEARELLSDFQTEIAQDLQENFAEKMIAAGSKTPDDDSVLNARDQRVMLAGLYAGISGPLSLAGIQLDKKTFYSKVGILLAKGARYGVLPSAITIGWLSRADLIVGKSRGKEMNFYLEKGVLKVSSYHLKTLNVGLAAGLRVGYYVALCYGACTGGDVDGTYIGLDADVIFGVGANVYVEVGVDTTDYYKAKKTAQKYTLSSLYEAKAVYIGLGVDFGFGVGLSLSFYDYRMTSDVPLIDLYQMIDRPNFEQSMQSAFKKANLFKGAPGLP